VLVSAAAVALVSGHTLDAAAIVAVLLLNATLGFLTDLPARRALEALTTMQVARAMVVRGGRPRDIEARQLVPGDVIALDAGQAVPADARLLAATELRTVEAVLTGECRCRERRSPTLPPRRPRSLHDIYQEQRSSQAGHSGDRDRHGHGSGRTGTLAAAVPSVTRRSSAD
jgi:magnesium-transporting ATPase (P-type)